jgi:hypothetical protein
MRSIIFLFAFLSLSSAVILAAAGQECSATKRCAARRAAAPSLASAASAKTFALLETAWPVTMPSHSVTQARMALTMSS